MIIGISGKKQSGKSTSGNFIYSLMMVESGVAAKAWINWKGQIEISDLCGDDNYKGVFDPCSRSTTDWNIQKAFQILDPVIKIYNFADILKQNICMDILGMTYNQCYGSDEEKNQLTDLEWEGKQLTARDAMQLIGTDLFRKLKTNVWAEATLKKIDKEKPHVAIITDCRFPNEVDAIKKYKGVVIRLTRKYDNSEHTSEIILDKERYDWQNFSHIIENDNMSIYDQCVELQNILKLYSGNK
jgi:hypothetical protein